MWGFRPGFLAALSAGGGGGSLPLDSLTVAPFFAVSYRKLRTAYGGNCCRIRRFSDNAEQDFGFVGNVVDTAGIATFIGGGDRGFVTKRYNQAAGASVDALQTTGSSQSEIYQLGSFMATIGSHGGVADSNASEDKFMLASAVPLGGTQLQAVVVARRVTTSSVYDMGVQIHGTSDSSHDANSSVLSACLLVWLPPRVTVNRNAAYSSSTFDNTTAGAAPSTSTFVHSVSFDGTSMHQWFNGALVLTAPSTGSFDTSVDLRIGDDEDSHYWDGNIPEIILQAGANSADRIAIETSANTFWRT